MGGPSLEQKPLGRTGRTISAVGLGCVAFGREIDEASSYRVMDYAVEHGITFFDTAEEYGGGQARRSRRATLGVDDVRETTGEMSSSERIIGTWMRMRGCRDEITLCTKVSTGGSADNVAGALRGSLERLQTDHVDILKMHYPDTTVPVAETLGALSAEAAAGRIGAIGGSNYSEDQLREALETSASNGYRRFEIIQPHYNLLATDAERDLFPLCVQEEIAIAAYSPLAAGFLSGKYTPDRTKIPARTRFDTSPGHIDLYFDDLNFRIVEQLRAKSAEIGVPMVKLAMAWAMANVDVASVLIGARSMDHVDNALEAYDEGLDPQLHAEMASWD